MIEGLPLGNIGATGLLTLVVLLILTDRLVWHKRLDALQKQIDAANALNAELAKQNSVLLGSAVPTVNAVLSALQNAAEKDSP